MSVTVLDISKTTQLILKIDRVISKAEMDEIQKTLEKHFPTIEKCLILDAGQSITFV